MNDWHDVTEALPEKSGYYEVEDRTGRQFRTWYELTIHGFSMVYRGKGFKIVKWKEVDDGKEKNAV